MASFYRGVNLILYRTVTCPTRRHFPLQRGFHEFARRISFMHLRGSIFNAPNRGLPDLRPSRDIGVAHKEATTRP
jgi:hypothetical protein